MCIVLGGYLRIYLRCTQCSILLHLMDICFLTRYLFIANIAPPRVGCVVWSRVERLIKKKMSPEDRQVDDTYDIISKAYIATGRDRMLKHLSQKYSNITTKAVLLFRSYSLVCKKIQVLL